MRPLTSVAKMAVAVKYEYSVNDRREEMEKGGGGGIIVSGFTCRQV